MGGTMRAVRLAVVMAMISAIPATLAHAEDMAAVLSKYRRAHGLSTVKTDPQLTAIAERQAKAMAATGVMDHSVAGSFSSRISGVQTRMASENIAAGTKSWAETFRVWQQSRGHNANLLQSRADSVGVAVARNERTPYKTYWAMVIADKAPIEKPAKGKSAKDRSAKKKGYRVEARAEPRDGNTISGGFSTYGTTENPLEAVKSLVCKVFC
ncbi:MAG: CAP domain-containing protein [Xanthobacteraceae bacterium]